MSTDDSAVAYALARAAQRRRRRARSSQNGRVTVSGMRPQPPAASPTQRRGSAAEESALAWLEQAGLTLLARNLRCRLGEIDLLMRDGDVLVFVEVRARGRGAAAYGGAAASVEHSKQK